MSNLRYRFDELITTINLLPANEDITEDMEIDPLFPNLTRDLHEPELYSAILCQTLKGDVEFRHKMSATLANSAMTNIMQNHEANEDDMYALAIAANILWATGAASELFSTMGILGRLCDQYEMELPDLATAFLRGNRRASNFSKLDPYKILAGEYDPQSMLREALDDDNLLDKLRGLIHEDKAEE